MLKKLSGYSLALIGLTVLFASCKKDYESAQTIDSAKLSTYIAKNNLTQMVADPAKTGYYYQILTPGTGNNYAVTDSVLYNAEAKGLDNGTVYLSTPTYANLGSFVAYTNGVAGTSTISGIAIPALVDVLKLLKPGGSARILLPSYLAWGKNGSGPIPSNENIDITITTYADKNQTALDERLIQEFIATKGLTGMIRDPSGVYYNINPAGSGDLAIDKYSTINATYTLRFTDGTVLETAADQSFSLAGTIQAWQDVIPGKLKKGGKMRMLIPSGKAYGTSGSSTGSIPANSILDYDVEITGVTAPF